MLHFSRITLIFVVSTFISCQKKDEVSSSKSVSESSQIALDKQVPESGLVGAVSLLEEQSFSNEKEARQIENEGIVPLWDRFLAVPVERRLDAFAEFPFVSLTLGKASAPKQLDLGISKQILTEGGETIDHAKWLTILQQYAKDGYVLSHSDWHHAAYQRGEDGVAVSEVTFALQGSRPKGEGSSDRIAMKGTLRVVWDESSGSPVPKNVTFLNGHINKRSGQVAFKTRVVVEGGKVQTAERDSIGSLNVYDLNGDGLPEIILGNENKILWNKGDFQFEAGLLNPADGPTLPTTIGLVADINGDQLPDWICETLSGDLAFWFGKPGGGFTVPTFRVSLGKYQVKAPTCITAGDIDGDGDLDLFVGQWRAVYEKPPENFWDSNDGYGNTLLINGGQGNFTDGTEAAGLQGKRFRRTYSSSFLDLNGDNHLDLLLVSDFHGVDTFYNDGSGKFIDTTQDAVDNPYSFGMSHTVADYDMDGELDFYVLGMGSTTARRLDRMKANPEKFPEVNKMRQEMGYGNRMYLNKGAGKYLQPPFQNQVGRTGWAWGSTSFDFDNDGDQDVYAANGHISGQTTRDYCTNFWCRDIYVMKDFKKNDISKYLDTIPVIDQQSWDGYQVNALLVNQSGQGFENLGFVLDVGIDEDCRRIVSADLDLDGRVDLLIDRLEGTTGFFHDETTKHSPPNLMILQNVLPEAKDRSWIGVNLVGSPKISPLGATVSVKTTKGVQKAIVLSGDSYMAQHPTQKHFGLGAQTEVESITVTWPGGVTTTVENPKTRTYHMVAAPK